jgi:pimeloyl-ACP methyl ester carboxylesterase
VEPLWRRSADPQPKGGSLATAVIGGIVTRYDVIGTGTPLLMFSPGGFDATLDKWRTQSIYARIQPLDHLARNHTCIVFDRRETGESGGRVEHITWDHYVQQGSGLLQHLGIERAHIMGGCMGVSPAIRFGVTHPEATVSLLLFWPVGGARYRITSHQRFAEHLAYVKQHGLAEVVAIARASEKSFGQDPRGGPWVAVLRRDAAFADAFVAQDPERYQLLVTAMCRSLFDRDTAPGAEPEDLLRLDISALVIPGGDATHATSAARYLHECLPRSEYWDVPVDQQTEATAPKRMLDFLEAASHR